MKRLLVVLFFLLGFFILVGCENDYNDDYVVIRDINGEIVKGKEDMDAFYERTKKVHCVVVTGETRKYGNLLVKKGVIC